MTTPSVGYTSVPSALRGGFLEAVGAPALVLGAGYIGFGALAADANVSILLALASTISIYALPAQIVMIELWQMNSAFLPLVIAVMMTGTRFLPMTATLMPLLRHPRWGGWHYLLAAHCVAMTGWAVTMRRGHDMAAEFRLPYFCAFTFGMWLSCIAGTAAGFYLSVLFTDTVTLGLVFLNPLYFILILTRETRGRLPIIALACGAVVGPPVHMLIPDWSLIVGGTLAGLMAFAITEVTERKV